MVRFLLGLFAGVVLAILAAVITLFVAVRLSARPPEVAPRSVLVLDLKGEIVERAPLSIPFPFFESRTPLTVADIWRLLRAAQSDPRIKAVVLMPDGIGAGWGILQEIQGDLKRFSSSGKPVWAYLKAPSTREYYLAAGAGRVLMSPEDILDLKGLMAELTYFRGTLNKLGVQVDIERAGKYKDYGEMFTRADMSPETREVMNSILDDLYGQLLTSIAGGRKKSTGEVRDILNDGPFLSRQALSKGLVDGLEYEDQVFSGLEKQTGGGSLKRISSRDYLRAIQASEDQESRTRVALVVGEGTIVRGQLGSLSSDTGVEAEEFTKLLQQVGNDGGIRAAIVRIDSPGGDSFASDEIWKAMQALSRRKPVVISMSDEAASGGYYIAMTGDPIVAYPGTYTGSIGVFYGKVNLRGLYEKLGISKQLLSRGRFAEIDSDWKPLSEAERQKLKEGVEDNYRVFVEKVAEARRRKVEEVEPLCQGRVWLGTQAKQNGLVDELGGLERAIELIREKARIPRTERISLVPYPAKRTLWEVLMRNSDQSSAPAWALDFLKRWPVSDLMRGGMMRLAPVSIEVR